MKSLKLIGIALFLTTPAFAANSDACSASSSASDVHVTLALDTDHAVFQAGEIIPLSLSFTSTIPHRYHLTNRSYDRSGRLMIDQFCLEPQAPDPLTSYFQYEGFFGGGLFNYEELGAAPFTTHADLNEYHALAPGHYRLYAISNRVSRPSEGKEQESSPEVNEPLRSNAIEFDVKPASRAWQHAQLAEVMQQLATPAPPANSSAVKSYTDVTRNAARRLRFLNTKDSTKALAELFSGRDSEQPHAWDFAFGLYGSPHRQLAIESMHQQIAHPDHAITPDFLELLVKLEIDTDPAWDTSEPSADLATGETTQTLWQRRRAHETELLKPLTEETMAALPRKTARARALTALGLLTSRTLAPAETRPLRSELIASWNDLPRNTRDNLIQFQWAYIFGHGGDSEATREMLPILMPLVAAPPQPSSDFYPTPSRDAALRHIYEIDPDIALPILLRDLRDPRTGPSLELIKLLPPGEIAAVIPAAADRIARSEARPLDYTLIDRYADTSVLPSMQAVFEQDLGKWSCAPQAAMLRYFLRVAPEYGAAQVSASLHARNETFCYRMLLQELGDQLPHAETIAIEALNDSDPEVTLDALVALNRWGTSEAEAPLWARLDRLHQEWANRVDDLHTSTGDETEGSRAVALEQDLVTALAGGPGWLCTPDKLIRLRDLTLTSGRRRQVQSWIDTYKQGPPMINPMWSPDQETTFSLLQSSQLTADQLTAKLAMFPRGTRIEWQFWQPGQISPPVSIEKQDAAFERQRAAAEEHGVTLIKSNYPSQ